VNISEEVPIKARAAHSLSAAHFFDAYVKIRILIIALTLKIFAVCTNIDTMFLYIADKSPKIEEFSCWIEINQPFS